MQTAINLARPKAHPNSCPAASEINPERYKTARIVRSPIFGDQFEIGEFVGVEYAGCVFNSTTGQNEDSYRIFTRTRQAYVLASYLGSFCL